jgi:hypothetical protein
MYSLTLISISHAGICRLNFSRRKERYDDQLLDIADAVIAKFNIMECPIRNAINSPRLAYPNEYDAPESSILAANSTYGRLVNILHIIVVANDKITAGPL